MPNVTQTRTLPVTPVFKSDNHLVLTPSVYNTGITAPTQTTTSYRTGRVQDTDDVDDFTKSSAVNFSTLKQEYEDRSSTWDSGHEFATERQFCDDKVQTLLVKGNPAAVTQAERDYLYRGPVFLNLLAAPAGQQTVYPSAPSVYSTLTVDGPKAIQATIPTNPASNLAQGIAEVIREGLPHAIGATALKARADLARVAGKEYLNVEFGWKPLVSDIVSAARAVVDSQKLLRQYARDSGRNVRRSFEFEPVSSSIGTVWNGNLVTNGVPTRCVNAWTSVSTPVTSNRTNAQKRWFRGAYTYHANLGTSAIDRMDAIEQKANHLLGLRLTPEIVWELAPWSWLFDWVGNIGDNMTNASRFSSDSLVMRYGYIMVESTVVWDRTWYVGFKAGGSATQTFTSGVIRKQRFKATPYGFGLLPSGFSARQWTILGALGLTRAPQALG